MDQLKFEEAEQNKKNAQKNEQKMQERIRELTKKRNADRQQANSLNKRLGDVSHGRMQIEAALRNCEEIRNRTLPAVRGSVTEASTECDKTFESSFGGIGLLGIYEEDLNQTQKELNEIFHELTERLLQVKQQEAVINADISRVKKEISSYENEITACKNKERMYARQVQEYTVQMNRYRQ